MSNHANLQLVEVYPHQRRGLRVEHGVYLDESGNVFIDVGAGEPRPATLHYALEFMADHHEEPERYPDSQFSFERFFRLLAERLPEA